MLEPTAGPFDLAANFRRLEFAMEKHARIFAATLVCPEPSDLRGQRRTLVWLPSTRKYAEARIELRDYGNRGIVNLEIRPGFNRLDRFTSIKTHGEFDLARIWDEHVATYWLQDFAEFSRRG